MGERAWLGAWLAIAGCGTATIAEDAGNGVDGPGIDVGTPIDAQADDAGGPRTSGVVEVSSCATLGTGGESCFYSFAWSPGACGGACSRLVIYFSGGQETCPAVEPPARYLAEYSAAGYVAVCARDFETSTGSARFPRHEEASRFDALVRAITTDPDVSRAWTGEHLLLTGVSHGASGPMIALAHATPDRAALWRGTGVTAACFYDGTYDAAELLSFTHGEGCTSAAIVPYERVWSRYCAWPAGADPAAPATWPSPGGCATADTAADTIVATDVSAIPVHDVRLIECGSGLPDACGALAMPLRPADVIPEGSIRALCDHIDAAPDHTCTLGSYPSVGHVACSLDAATRDDCRTFFEARVAAGP